MAGEIFAHDLKWFKSERMTDNSDGGGQMTANEIVVFEENQVFDDISDVDRAAGDVSIRLVYAAVGSVNDAKYLDAGVAIIRHPEDANVSVTAFTNDGFYDERSTLVAKLESMILRGGLYNGFLWGPHSAGQMAVTFWQRLSAELPSIGARIELVAMTNSVETHHQTIWITRVVVQEVERMHTDGTPYYINQVTLELSEALRNDYVGIEPTKYDPPAITTGTRIHTTRYNSNAVEMVGIRPLVSEAGITNLSVSIDSIYSPVIPLSMAETPLADLYIGGSNNLVVAGNSNTISFTTTLDCIAYGLNMFLGSAALPGSVSIAVSSTTITDLNGDVYLNGIEIGQIDYGSGVITWGSTCPSYDTAPKVVTFKPAVSPNQVPYSASQEVTVENRGFVWVKTMNPPPEPGTLIVRYRVNNEWYMLYDNGLGALSGVNSSYGSGVLNYSTGTATITTGQLPDPESDIMFTYNVKVTYIARGGNVVDPPKIKGQTGNPDVAANSFSVTWTLPSSETVAVNDNGAGVLSGTGGTGNIHYGTGKWEIIPSVVPAKGTEFTIVYDHGPGELETFTDPVRDGNGKFNFTLAKIPLINTVVVEWDTEYADMSPPDTPYTPPPVITPTPWLGGGSN